MALWFGREYNFEEHPRPNPDAMTAGLTGDVRGELKYFQENTVHAGSRAPDFCLPALDGSEVTLSELRGKPVLIEFGSLTCPNCQHEFPLIDQLSREYAGRAHFLFVYIREAHPAKYPDWPAHRSLEQKFRHARALAEQHQTPRVMLVDTLNGEVHRLFGGLSNTSWIIDHAGLVAHKASWTTYRDLRRVLDEVLLLREDKRLSMRAPLFTETMSLRPRYEEKARKAASKRERHPADQ